MAYDRYRMPSGRDGRTMYDDEPWAHLARAAGFEPFDTESSARSAFRFMAALSDESVLVESVAKAIALGNNGGGWATHYTDEQKAVWRARAGAVIALVRASTPSPEV